MDPQDQTGKAIPGIPVGAIDAIEDPRVREVLRALVSTHNVRNDLAGTGNEAFITIRQALQASRNIALPEAATPRLPAQFARGSGGTLGSALATIDITLDTAANFAITAWCQTVCSSSGASLVEVKDGTGAVLLSQADTIVGSYVRPHVASAACTLAAGSNSLSLFAESAGGSYTLGNWALLVVPVL